MMPAHRSRSGGQRKIGRNKAKCEKYRNEHRREKNKIRKLRKMIKNLDSNNKMRIQAEKRIEELKHSIYI